MYNFGFTMEQTLGHITHHKNLAHRVEADSEIRPIWMPIAPEGADLWERVPVITKIWALKASLRTRDALRAALKETALDAVFIHTQSLALFSAPPGRRVPIIISLDATPINYDSVAAAYGDRAGNISWQERRKYLWYCKAFASCAALVTWCQWAKDSLVEDYHVPADKVTVIPPGVDLDVWNFTDKKIAKETRKDAGKAESASESAEKAAGKAAEKETNQEHEEAGRNEALPEPWPGELPRLLFVGGDFARKGGHTLLDAYKNGLQGRCTLDIVTKEEGVEEAAAGTEGIRIHRGLTANSDALRALYARADLFVFPTLGDCLPIAVMEAMAAGLPIIATDVGALREEVENGVNGVTVPPGDAAAVTAAVLALIADTDRLRAMGIASRQLAVEKFDAKRNYDKILALMKAHAKMPGGAGVRHGSEVR